MRDNMGPSQMLLLLAAAWWSGVLTEKPNLDTGHLLNAETIALEQYGVVLKPGKLMSNADVTHVQQGLSSQYLRKNRIIRQTLIEPANNLFGPDSRACNKIRALIGWMHLTSNILRKQFKEVVGETLLALQKTGEETATVSNQDQPERGKRATKLKLPKIMDDPGWPSFPIPTSWNSGLASDIKYNRELIEVLQQTSSGTLDELAGLTNRTEMAIDRADKLTWDLLQNIKNHNIGQNNTRRQVRKLSYEIDGMGVALSMLPIALEDKLG